jgi:hypothetical protein
LNRRTASTILLLGNTGDPALPYQDVACPATSPARLLTIDGYGHTSSGNPSTCALNYEIGYLLTGTLPTPGPSAPRTPRPSPPHPGNDGTCICERAGIPMLASR